MFGQSADWSAKMGPGGGGTRLTSRVLHGSLAFAGLTSDWTAVAPRVASEYMAWHGRRKEGRKSVHQAHSSGTVVVVLVEL